MTDKTDDRLFSLLKEDGRSSISTLSHELAVSRGQVSARLSDLISKGQIQVTAIINPKILGLNVLCHVGIQMMGPSSVIAEQILQIEGAAFVSVTSGIFDIVAELRAPDQQQLFALVAEIRKLPNVIAVNTLVYIDIFKSPFTSELGNPKEPRLDAIDFQIMQVLQEDGRVSYKDLSTLLKISPSSTRARVKQLIEQNVIRITTIVKRNSGARNMALGVGINARGSAVSVAQKIVNLEEVEFVATAIGTYDIVCTLSGGMLSTLQDTIDRIRSFDEVIRVSTWMHMEIVRENYGGSQVEHFSEIVAKDPHS